MGGGALGFLRFEALWGVSRRCASRGQTVVLLLQWSLRRSMRDECGGV